MSLYKTVTTPKNTIVKKASIKGFGNIVFSVAPENVFDIGVRFAKNNEYRILAIENRSNEDNAPFAEPMNIDGFTVKIGTEVTAILTKDAYNEIPTELIIETATNTPLSNPTTKQKQIIKTYFYFLGGGIVLILILILLLNSKN